MPALGDLNNAEWGLIKIQFGAKNQRDYIDTYYKNYLFSKDGNIDLAIRIGEWNLFSSLWLKRNDNGLEIASHGKEIEDKMAFVNRLIPLIQNCKTFEEVNAVNDVLKVHEEIHTEQQLVETLVQENNSLKNQLEKCREKLYQIQTIVN